MAIITQNGDYTVKLYNSNGSVISDNYKLSQIIADLIASGYDCNALILHQYSSYGYGSLVAFKVTETGLYYVGDNDLMSGLGSNATLFQKDNITFNQHYYTYTSGSPVDRGSISLSTQTINGLEYYYDYDGNVANEPIIYVDSSISLVVNDMLSPSGGAGSGYIGNSLLSNKKMVGYNVHTSSEESTKTESVNEASESPVSGKPKIGNGFARIKLIEEFPQELVLYSNGQVNTRYFDVNNVTIGSTQSEPISKSYEVESNHLLLEYDNWRDTTGWRGILINFDGKDFPSCYTKVKLDVEVYAKYNSSWASIELNVNDNQTGVKNFNGGVNVRKVSDTRYQIGGQSSFEATSRYETDEMELLLSNTNHLVIEFSGVNQYHEGYVKIYKITLIQE